MDGHHSPRPTSGLASHTRAKSTSSTAASYPLTIPPNAVSPEPAFIDASAAAQIVTNDHDSHADAWYDQNGIEPSGAPVQVSDGALKLLNGFLDQLLLNVLKASPSTNLSDLRPAIAAILKPNLASDVIENAEKDLVACKITRAEAEHVQPIDDSPSRTRDVELIWKRMRLRCMVYSSLGEVEDEDAAMYMKQEHLEVGVGAQVSDVISPAVAIFMTSVIEYMGELTLTVAGQAAYQRVRCDIDRGLKDGSRQPGDMADQIIVGEADMERVALDMTLGRLWRGWKKRLRSRITDNIPRPISHIASSHSQHGHLASPKSFAGDTNALSTGPQEYAEEVIVEHAQPFDIPLPMGPCDVGEIELPGLVNYSDEESEAEDEFSPSRPKSSYAKIPDQLTFNKAGKGLYVEGVAAKTRRRSSSMPHTTRAPFFIVSIPGEGTAEMHVPAQESEPQPNEQLVSDLSEEDVSQKHMSRRLAPIGLGLTTPRTQNNKTSSKTSVVDDVAWDSDGPEEVATFEKAELITSSRVSVDSSPSSASSESPKKGHKRSTSSMHSARIIDVQAPKSPTTYSRQGSLENAHVRSASLSGAAAFAGTAVVAGATGALLATKSFHDSSPVEKSPSSPLVPSSRTQVERATPTVRNAGTISESEEGSDYHTAHGNSEAPAAVATSGNVVTRGNRNAKSPMTLDVEKATRDALGAREPLSPRLVNTSYDGKPSPNPAMIAEARSPGHSPSPRNLHGFRDNKAPGTLETLRAQEEDEEFSTALHSVGPARTIHTSGSSGSSATGRMKVVRSSEENSSTGRSGSVVRNFEELIQSNQTITYTLTPESMRHADSSKPSLDSPVVTKFPRRSEDARSPINSQPSPTTSVSPSTFRGQGFENSSISEAKPSGPIPRAPAGIAVTTGRMDGPQARDARVPSETTSDFAQFIKSTGPTPESRQLSGRASNDKSGLSGPVPRAPDSARRASTISNKSRFQPREPVTSKNDTRDLIDFIRQGPPIAASNHRIPRHVAPFRTTMDSDQLAGVPGGKAVDANIPDLRYSQGSTNVTENSLQSSLNSNSALLKGRGGNSKIASIFGEDDMPMPQRKTRRVRDPYAIDVSDEDENDDEDVLAAAPAPPVKAKREESLAEFLRNYNPPAEPTATTRHIPKKKASAPSLIGRFTRSNTAKDTASIASVDGRSLNSRASHRGHVPIQISMPPGYDKYGAIEAQSTGRPRISSVSGSSGRVPMKKFEPREPRERAGDTFRSETSDLAAFLRNSGPPEAPPVQPARAEEPSSGLSRMFGRRKRTAA
ncbi:hypothetical protein ISF_02777 [Cordyceps fumosorosea ARSEF 2679]|uniref:Flo11 n=1 Tax=Cordyceps fumosorosea (strain ARSEF 2679) TaxID=1081104 RepID=A0A168B217_CORFA|nr:hypothetical protein ISF_02777 [Cordyceps fumosorosea ARSEF 2679]OAA69507.1 hypothetical protein ISF_02777 [Cordyceps fumosorosea ARSEF 2679]